MESLLLKHQLLISNRSRQRAPNLTTLDRFVIALTMLFVSPAGAKLGAALAQGWRRRGYELAMSIGIAQGYATTGSIGIEGRDYGGISTVTNLASRLCGEASGGQILITQRVRGHIAEIVTSEVAGELSLKGFHRPVPAVSVSGFAK